MPDSYELDVRLGPDHFVAKGPEEAVREDYAKFLEKVVRHAISRRSCGKGWPAIEPELTEFFAAHEDGIVSLKRVATGPRRDARSLLLLLYGFLMIESRSQVTASELLTAAERSGLSISRTDRVIKVYIDKGLVIRSGVRRGTRYSLTDEGIQWTSQFLAKRANETHED